MHVVCVLIPGHDLLFGDGLLRFRGASLLRAVPKSPAVFGFCDCAVKQSPRSPASTHPSYGFQIMA
jgi:hypothetical protein